MTDPASPALTVELLDDRRTIEPGEDLTFGRAADLVVDEGNQYLHRVLGRFTHHDGLWWVENLGQHIELELHGADGTVVRLPARPPDGPASASAITDTATVLAFEVAGARYELDVSLPAAPGPSAPAPEPTGTETLRFGRITLTDEERALLVGLAEPVLRDRSAGSEDLPTNREVAHRLGWSQTKFNRKLDYLCVRLTKAGVRGLQGGRGAEALNRRWRLVEHAVAVRLVTPDDLPD